MKDLREIENCEEEKSNQKAGWLSCAVCLVWDCLKIMGRGFKADSEFPHRPPKFPR